MTSNWQRLAVILVLATLSSCGGSKGVKSEAGSASVTSGSGPVLVVSDQIPFAQNAEVRQAVRDDCRLPDKLSQFIRQYVADYSSQIISDPTKAPKGAQILIAEIYSVTGGGGGTWSGGKSVSVQGRLEQDGKIIGTFKGRRFSGGGVFGGYKGTCAIMGRCVKTLGRDIAEWLRQPTDNAILGDM